MYVITYSSLLVFISELFIDITSGHNSSLATIKCVTDYWKGRLDKRSEEAITSTKSLAVITFPLWAFTERKQIDALK